VLLKPTDGLLLTAVQNKTSDPALEGAILGGLEIDLRQSRYLKVLGEAAAKAGRLQLESEGKESTSRTSAQIAAQHVGAKAYLYGEVEPDGSGYLLSVDVLDTQSNDKLMSLTEQASSREAIPTAIDRLALALRDELGESRQSVAESTLPLAREATADVDALNQYSIGERAAAARHIADELSAYQHAVERDPKFAVAQMKLAWLYHEEKADAAAAKASEIALNAARNADNRLKLLAEFCYEMNSTGNYDHALATIRGYNDRFPYDADGMIGLARVLRAQGHIVEALLAAQQAYGIDTYNAEAYREAEESLIGLDRYDDALQLSAQTSKLGVVANESMLIAEYLAKTNDAITSQLAQLRGSLAVDKQSYSAMTDYGLYLDNTGQLSAGGVVWKLTSNAASHLEGLASSGASLLAQGALDNALANNCTEGVELGRESRKLPSGAKATFYAGLASALCGDMTGAEQATMSLQKFSNSTLVSAFYLPDIQATELFRSKRSAESLDIFMRVTPRDSDLLTPYLRGLVEIDLGREKEASRDFQTVLQHHGLAVLQGSNVYPMAELAYARALTVGGDMTGGAAAYKDFLGLWNKADKGQTFVAEASSNSH
jgi:serine/threonine-protein kinase